MVLVKRTRKARKNAPRKARKTAKRRTARRRRKNPIRSGKHRPVLIYSRSKGWKRPKRSHIKKAFRVNPKRRRRARRNPKLSLKSILSKQNLMQMTAVAGGLTVGFLGIPMLLKIAPSLGANRKYLGGANIAVGLLLAGMGKKSYVKTAGMTMAAVGLYDLVSQNVPTLGLPLIADTAAIVSKMIPDKTSSSDTVSADYLPAPMAADFMSADYETVGNAISELTF